MEKKIYTKDNLPHSIIFTGYVEIFEPGNIAYLYYAGTTDAMYKIGNGAIFGISEKRAIKSLNDTSAVECL